MEMSNKLFTIILAIIIIVILLIVIAFLLESVYGSDFVKKIVCGMLYWIPFGSIFTELAKSCALIPA
jgi:hypothetical protein